MTKSLLRAFLLCLIAFSGAHAQTNTTANLLKQLLDLPSPPPVSKLDLSETAKPERPVDFYDSKNIPPDDAPIDVLLDFWQRQNNVFNEFRYNLRPSKETLRRLIEEIEKDPQKLPNYIKLFPTDPDIADFVRKLYELEKKDPQTYVAGTEAVHRWLRNNSDMFISELIAGVREIKEENGRASNQEDLISLAKIDWNIAKTFVETLERNDPRSGSYVLAKYVRYHHALRVEDSSDTEKYRAELKRIVEDKTASHKARDLAMDALVLGGDFEGRDDWYVSLLADETLLELQENGYTGLTTLVRHSPNDREKWIPLMTRLLTSTNATLRSVAVRNLLQLNGFTTEIALHLLPWLGNAEWATESRESERDELIKFLGENDVPECVPGLIQILTNEENYVRSLAAKSLIRYKSPAAIPALRAALQNETDLDYRVDFIEALIVSGGMSDAEQLAGLEAYAVSVSNRKQSEESEDGEEYEEADGEENVPIELSVGVFLKDYENPRDSLVSMALQRVKALRKINPKVADILSGIIQNWESRVVDLEMLELAGGPKADVGAILKVLIRREEMRERIPNELAMMRDGNAMQRALSAIISNNISDQAYILNQGDADSQIALLALARLVRVELHVGEVGALTGSPNKMLALAAERYLESEDSVEARTLILSKRKGEARILGAQHAFIPDEKKNYEVYTELLKELFDDTNGSDYWSLDLSELNKSEDTLRAEFKTSEDLLAIYAFIEDYLAGQKVLRVYKDKIVFTYYETGARYWEKHITTEEYETMYNFLLQNRVDTMAPSGTSCARDCPNREFVMLGRDGGRRIFYRHLSAPAPLDEIEEMFNSFNTGARRLHYWLADKIPGLEVLMSAKNFSAQVIWKNGSDFRVLVEDMEKEEKILEDIKLQEKGEDENDNLTYSERSEIQRARRSKLAYKHFSWRKFENGQFGEAEVSQPSGIDYLSENMQVTGFSGKYIFTRTPKTYRRRAGNFEIRTERYYSGDLVKVYDSGASVTFKEGRYSDPIVTPDGKWVIAGKSDEDSPRVNAIVRINLQTGKEFSVNIPPANEFSPIAFVDAHNKILLYRARDEDNEDKNNPSPKTPEYYLLDAATGAFQLARGEFRPLQGQTFRGLQPTNNANEFWAAIFDDKAYATQIGFYDAKSFTFKPVLDLPKIALDSMDIWIDKPAAKVYFVYSGHVLSLPLANPANQP